MGEPSDCGLPQEFCCVSLKKGVKFIGIACLIISVVSSILLIVYLAADPEDLTREISDNNEHMKQKLDHHTASTRTAAGLLLATFILYGVSSVALLKGVSDQSKKLILPFLILTVIVIFGSIVIAITGFESGAFFAILTISVILLYFFLCTLAHYKEV